MSKAGLPYPRANTRTRSGTLCTLSTSMRMLDTSERASRGAMANSSAERPATDTVPTLRTDVVLSSRSSIWIAACWGEVGSTDPSPDGRGDARGDGSDLGAEPVALADAGRRTCVTAFLSLDHVQRFAPSRMMSDSPSVPSNATRVMVGPAHQTRRVWEPDSNVVQSATPSPPRPFGNAGSPRSAFSTTVPDTAFAS